MVVLKNQMLMASTLLESLVAMVVVMAVIVICSLTYTSTLKSDNLRMRLHASLMMDKIAAEACGRACYLDGEIEDGLLMVRKSFRPYPGKESLYIMKLEAYDKMHVFIADQTRLIARTD
jgi:hypothetical protein